MGIGNTLMILAVILGLVWYLFPEFTESTWDKIVNLKEEKIEEHDYIITDEGKDYGKIFGHLDCVLDSDCKKAFEIEGLICTDRGNCLMVNKSG